MSSRALRYCLLLVHYLHIASARKSACLHHEWTIQQSVYTRQRYRQSDGTWKPVRGGSELVQRGHARTGTMVLWSQKSSMMLQTCREVRLFILSIPTGSFAPITPARGTSHPLLSQEPKKYEREELVGNPPPQGRLQAFINIKSVFQLYHLLLSESAVVPFARKVPVAEFD